MAPAVSLARSATPKPLLGCSDDPHPRWSIATVRYPGGSAARTRYHSCIGGFHGIDVARRLQGIQERGPERRVDLTQRYDRARCENRIEDALRSAENVVVILDGVDLTCELGDPLGVPPRMIGDRSDRTCAGKESRRAHGQGGWKSLRDRLECRRTGIAPTAERIHGVLIHGGHLHLRISGQYPPPPVHNDTGLLDVEDHQC